MKRYLLMAGVEGGSDIGTNSWIAAFATVEEARAKVQQISTHNLYNDIVYMVEGREKIYSWVRIVDLSKWID